MGDTNKPIQSKWGDALRAGYLVTPSVLLIRQYELGLSNSELVILLNILASWRDVTSLPRLNPTTIAKRMDVDARTVQRNISSLIAKRYIEKKLDIKTGVTSYNLENLVSKLKIIAPQLIAGKLIETERNAEH